MVSGIEGVSPLHRATKLEKALKEALPDAVVSINPEKVCQGPMNCIPPVGPDPISHDLLSPIEFCSLRNIWFCSAAAAQGLLRGEGC